MPSSAITATAPNGSSVIDMVQALYNARRDMREKKSYSSEEVRLYCLARSLILELLPEDVLDLDIITAHYLFVILGLYFLLMAIKFWVIGLDRDTNQQFWGDLNQDNEFMAMLEAEF